MRVVSLWFACDDFSRTTSDDYYWRKYIYITWLLCFSDKVWPEKRFFSITSSVARLKPPRERKKTKNEENITESLHYKVWWETLVRSPYEKDLHEARVEKNLWSDHIGRTGVPVRRRNKRLAIRLASADHIDRGYLHSQWYLPVLFQPDFAIIGQRAAVHGSKDPPRVEIECSSIPIELITDDDSLLATCGRR